MKKSTTSVPRTRIPTFSGGSSHWPDRSSNDRRSSNLAFYLLIGGLALGLLYFIVLAFLI